jgi:hypothetical protein
MASKKVELEGGLDGVQEPDGVQEVEVEVDAAVNSPFVSDMRKDGVVFQNEMSHFPRLSKDDGSRKRALRERFRWLWKLKCRAAQLNQELERKRQFLEVEVVANLLIEYSSVYR